MKPAEAADFARAAEARGVDLSRAAVDPGAERFILRLPRWRPAAGYGLIVYVSPIDQAAVPPGWASVLDQAGMLFVAAGNAGNDRNTFTRREPLALIAAAGVRARYPVDPARIVIAGFSGGARVAERLALGYPDLFAGALLNAGSDPLGPGGDPMPPAPLMHRFMVHTRIVFATGEWDSFHLEADDAARLSLRPCCGANLVTLTMPHTGHTTMDAATLRRALAFLDKPPPHQGG